MGALVTNLLNKENYLEKIRLALECQTGSIELFLDTASERKEIIQANKTYHERMGKSI